MKKILIPTDFSEATLPALRLGSQISKVTGAPIKLLHTYEMKSMNGFGDILGTPRAVLEEREHSKQHKESMAQAKINEMLVKAKLDKWKWFGHVIIKEGCPKSTILHKIEKLNVGLTIFGISKNKEESEVMSRVACELISKSKSPIITVPKSSQGSIIKNIIYATSLENPEKGSLNKLADFASIFNARIHIVHFTQHSGNAKKSARKEFRLSKIVQEIPYPDHLKNYELVEAKDRIIALMKYAKKTTSTLIAMTTHTQSFLQQIFNGSFTRKVVTQTDYPILTFNKLNTGTVGRNRAFKHAQTVDFLL